MSEGTHLPVDQATNLGKTGHIVCEKANVRERWRRKRNDRQAQLEWQVQGNAMEIERCRAQNKGIRVARNGGLDDVAGRVYDCLQRIKVRVEVERAEYGDPAHDGRISTHS